VDGVVRGEGCLDEVFVVLPGVGFQEDDRAVAWWGAVVVEEVNAEFVWHGC
jgi:hypothetical protein